MTIPIEPRTPQVTIPLPTAEDMQLAAEAVRFREIMPWIESYVDRRVGIIEHNVFNASDNGVLTEDSAVAAWMEVKALRRMVRTLHQKINLGVRDNG